MASVSTCLRTTALSQGLAAGMPAERECSVQRSAFFGSQSPSKNALRQKVSEARARVTCAAGRKSRWAVLAEDDPVEDAPKRRVERKEEAPKQRVERKEEAPKMRVEEKEEAPRMRVEEKEEAPKMRVEQKEEAPQMKVEKKEEAPKMRVEQKEEVPKRRVEKKEEAPKRRVEKREETPKKKSDRWGALGTDMSDDQQDITRGRGMVDSVFQGASGLSGTQNAIMSSSDYISTAQRNLSNISTEGYYISPTFMDKLVIHITKNFLNIPNIKVPLILGVWGGKGQGKSFQAELVFAKLGINPIVMSAGELESGNAGEPAKLIRQRYREAADIIKKGKMCCMFINDLDAGAGRMGNTTQYTVNNQMVNATLMNIADNPTNVQLPGVYNKESNARVPIICTGNDFSTLYAPLIRDGRMEKFYWAPTREDRIGVCTGIFKEDNINLGDVTKLVDTFPGQSIDFFGALRARVYDDLVKDWAQDVGYENLGKNLVNSKSGPPSFEKPRMTLDILVLYGNKLVQEQENVKRVHLAEKYLSGAHLGDANEDDVPITAGTF